MKKFVEQKPFLFFYTLALVIFTGGIGIGITCMPDQSSCRLSSLNDGFVFFSLFYRRRRFA